MFLGEVRAPQAEVAPSRGSGTALLLPQRPRPDPANGPHDCGKLMEPALGLVSPIWKMGMRTPTSWSCHENRSNSEQALSIAPGPQ